MNNEPSLDSFSPHHEYYVGIDSDGCVFDSMELKHKECFCPAFIDRFELQACSRYAREVWEFVNLYSKTRGVNRFKALLHALNLCRSWAEIDERGVSVPHLPAVAGWVSNERKLGNPQLEARLARDPDPQLERALAWSRQVNRAVEEIVRNVPPFPGVRPVLHQLQRQADVVVVSQTPVEALHREWAEQEIDASVALIAGQELGTKVDHLRATAKRYPDKHVLMVGDAPGDLEAAQAVHALFFPVLPGREEESWRQLLEEGLDRFFSGSFAGDYQRSLLEEFDNLLPVEPPWRKL